MHVGLKLDGSRVLDLRLPFGSESKVKMNRLGARVRIEAIMEQADRYEALVVLCW